MSSASTLIKSDLRSHTNHSDLLVLSISIEKPTKTSADTHQKQTDGKPRKRLNSLWNRIFRRRLVASPQQQEQAVIPENGHLAITYSDTGMRRTHVSSMRKNKASVSGGESIEIVEFIDNEYRHGVRIKGILVVSVSGVEALKNFQTITATNPENTRELREIIGCGTTEGLVVNIPTVFTKKEWVMGCMERCRPEVGSAASSQV